MKSVNHNHDRSEARSQLLVLKHKLAVGSGRAIMSWQDYDK